MASNVKPTQQNTLSYIVDIGHESLEGKKQTFFCPEGKKKISLFVLLQ
jgi:hypothetical protein